MKGKVIADGYLSKWSNTLIFISNEGTKCSLIYFNTRLPFRPMPSYIKSQRASHYMYQLKSKFSSFALLSCTLFLSSIHSLLVFIIKASQIYSNFSLWNTYKISISNKFLKLQIWRNGTCYNLHHSNTCCCSNRALFLC